MVIISNPLVFFYHNQKVSVEKNMDTQRPRVQFFLIKLYI